MKRGLLRLMGGGLAAAALIPGLLLGMGLLQGPASAQEDSWQAMHEACLGGDYEAMLEAMRGVLGEEAYQAMLQHMNEVHPDWREHMKTMHRDDGEGMHGGPGRWWGMMGGGMMKGP